MKIVFLGGGSFGSALARNLDIKGYEVTIFDIKKETVNEINNNHTNNKYLKDIRLGEGIIATCDIKEAVEGKDIIVFSVPSAAVREVALKIQPYLKKEQVVVSIAKGIDPMTHKPLSSVLNEVLDIDAVILSGPSHAEEVALDLPTTLVSSSKNDIAMKMVQDVFSSEKLRVYSNDDLIGVEIGGAVKNIIALAAGISDGIGFGDNAKAALMTRGMSEIIKVGVKMGAKKETFYGLTGMGDLIVTCTSMHSRNRRAGILIGQGKSREEATEMVGMVVEGIKATKSFYELKADLGIEMPITDAVYSILFLNVTPNQAVKNLMNRDLKME